MEPSRAAWSTFRRPPLPYNPAIAPDGGIGLPGTSPPLKREYLQNCASKRFAEIPTNDVGGRETEDEGRAASDYRSPPSPLDTFTLILGHAHTRS